MTTKQFSTSNYIWIGFVLVLCIIGIKVSFFSSPVKDTSISRLSDAGLPVIGTIPNFALTNQEGKKITANDLRGKLWVANFIFTRCAGPCPLMSSQMATIQRKVGADVNIHYVSFSVDPDYDTPKVLKDYAEKYEATPEAWSFLTGEKKEIHELSTQHFYLGAGDVPPEEREQMDQGVFHSSKFVLVDSNLKIRGYYDSESSDARQTLIRDIEQLALEGK